MSKITAQSARIWVDGYDLSGFLNGTSLDLSQTNPVVTCFSDAGPRRLAGEYDHKQSHQGFFDAATAALDSVAFAALLDGNDHYISQLFAGSSENSVAYLTVARLSGLPYKAQLGGAHMLDVNAEGSNGLSRGLILGSAALVGTGNRTGRNMGATTAGQIFAVHFHLLAFNGTNITLKIQESSDDGAGDAYADIAGLTSGALTAIGAVRATTIAATEAYKRVNISGTFTTATIGVTAGVVAGT